MFFEYIDKYTIKSAPSPLKIEGLDIFTNDELVYNNNGFYRVIYNNYPNNNKVYTQIYYPPTPEQNYIVQDWEEVGIPLSEYLAEGI